MPIVQRLANEELLKRCQRNKTQNPNESLHQLIWKVAPKTVYTGRNTVETAVALALCQFSMGKGFRHILCQMAGFEAGIFLDLGSMKANKRRLQKAETASSYKARQRRKQLKFSKTGKEHKSRDEEGTTYAAGAFD